MRNFIVPNRLQVLAPLVLLAAPLVSRAQPPDNPVAISAPQIPEQPRDLPLLPITLDEWLKQNGGLSRLTLKMDKARADEIAAEVKKQTGIVLVSTGNVGGGENAPRFSVEATGQPFWEAVADWNRSEKGDKADAPTLSLQRDWQNRERWQLVTWGSIPRGRVLSLGPVTIFANSISLNRSRSRSLDPAEATKDPTESQSMYVQASRYIDPKLAPLVMGMLLQIDGATDDRGRAITSEETWQNPQIEDNEYVSFSMKAPARDAVRLRSLKGTARLAVLTKSERWEIDLKATPQAEKEFKSETTEVKVQLQNLVPRTIGGGWKLSLRQARKDIGTPRVFRPKGRDNGTNVRLGDYDNALRSLRVLNEAGELMPLNGFDSAGTEENGTRITNLEINIGAQHDGEPGEPKPVPAKLVVDVPLEWREIQIPFELKDLPLP
jgi:hypothetical protein